MRAARFDLSPSGSSRCRWTHDGEAEYAAAQRGFAERGAPLRARLVEACERLLAV